YGQVRPRDGRGTRCRTVGRGRRCRTLRPGAAGTALGYAAAPLGSVAMRWPGGQPSTSAPSRTDGLPRRTVATTRAGSSIPAYGLLVDSEANCSGSTVHRAAGSTTVTVAGSPTCNGRP